MTIMKNTIETLTDAIDNGLSISAVYAPNGEVVKILNADELASGSKPCVLFQDGSEDVVDRNDLIDFTWK